MFRFKSFWFVCWGVLLFSFSVNAQILDDEGPNTPQNESLWLDDSVDDEEAFFNEVFSDHPETERDITKIKTFGDALDQVVGIIPPESLTKPDETEVQEEQLPPLEGDLFIGITNGSFNISKNTQGKPTCQFTVTLTSTLNRKIKVMALNLIYPNRNFAFIFRDVEANGYQVHPIRTVGDICYNLVGIPDISIHTCKIYSASGKECAARIKWDENIKMPEGAKDPFQYFNQ